MTYSLRPYQDEAADFLYERNRAMILAPVGAGKTAITLTAMQDMLANGVVKRFLVLAPKRVCTDVWPVEQPKWAPDVPVVVAVGTPKQRTAALRSKAQIVVSNYDNIQWLAEQALDFDAIVFDELTRLKNPSGTRFKALMKVIDPMTVRWGLTGSFTSNGLEDVFGQCKIVDQSLLGRSKGAFMQQYFVLINPDFGEWAPRVGALAGVMARIKPATYVLEPGEYKDKLPPMHVVEVRCDLYDREPYEKMKKDFQALDVTAINAGVVTGKLQQMASGFVYDTRRTASETPGKFDSTQTPIWFSAHKFDRLEELLDENQHANTIIVYQYQEELAEIKRRFTVTTLDDVDAIERWNAGKVRLLAVHPKSAGHGLNLQFGGCHMVFLSLPWSLELYEQTVGRLHRSGQAHAVWVYVMMTNKTVDEKIWGALHDKRAVSAIAMEALK
ncbi:HELICc domain containing protein [uncultured Caudovirales phage]|uniref:HELICc domain containing protein n=1 Tax=uncultured Caudovirales phage TaxID=2100421 RepID=A0A6J7WDJ9_9CAUD|nr:HELICc domain containing protein [uncultured Caudovirales phage]